MFAFIIYLLQDSTNREEMIYCVITVTSGMDASPEHTWSDVGVDGKSTQNNSQLIYVTYPCFVTSEQKKLRCTFSAHRN